MKLNLTLNEINLILTSLGKMPYESVFELVGKIREQAEPQLQYESQSQPKQELEAVEVVEDGN